MIRLWAFLAATAAFVGAYLLGTTTEVGEAEAEEFMEGFGELVEGIDAFGIFAHNATLTVPMFIPALGPAAGLFSAWSTGYAFAAISAGAPLAQEIPPIAVLLTPFGLMELAAYSLAISRSALFGAALVRSRPARPHLRMVAIEGGIAAALLAAGAAIEHAAITAAEAAAGAAHA
ncbi:MAG: stage II sporulation protein M [Thaumarchaeota archaeon]|nr:stage II sporulation protein M [Nitrososphaerota archaeon]MDD9842797.1 stage II sporulation protein M [Nitrososphaerota archaeon]RNJ71866.1 MAG: stage II sporulation protein M [Thaumarchaeota archaeon S13]RNJ73669.1 MAG: stage II sporulation protein M [Thaumarchaeota archaeon S15]